MSVLALFFPPDSDELEMCHTQISYSTTRELQRRLANFACDIYVWDTAMVPLGHSVTDCTVLWGLVGTFHYINEFHFSS